MKKGKITIKLSQTEALKECKDKAEKRFD